MTNLTRKEKELIENPFELGLTTLFGMKIIEAPMRPKMRLAPGDYVTPEFRQEIDAWLLEFFGTYNMVEDDQYFLMETFRKAYMNPRTYAKLKQQI